MIPIIEFEGIFAIIIALSILVCRLYTCSSKYSHDFIIGVIITAILSTIVWVLFGIYHRSRNIILQSSLLILAYLIILLVMANGKM
jgi:hypothetical protein